MVMGRKRTGRGRGLPDNLYPNRDGYKYRHPLTKKETWLGIDRARAIATAKKANALLVSSTDLVQKIIGGGHTISDAIKLFRREDVPERAWGDKTTIEHDTRLRRIEKEIGNRALEHFGVQDCAEFLRRVTESRRARQLYRTLLIWVFACAVEDGWIESNPAALTRKVTGGKRQRERLTIEGYRAIRQHAEPWLQNAMDLSLKTLLRREDICALRRTDVRDGRLWVIPRKTEGSTGAKLKIKVDAELAGVIERCNDGVLSPYLVHRLPEKARPQNMRAKKRDHHTQVLPEQLTREFAIARDDSQAYANSERPPTFHEIRSLGGALRQQAGWTVDQVQALMAHASEAMTEVYLAGHETPWTEVDPGAEVLTGL